ncbi:MAG: hypothetical protein ACRELA_14875 [Candidatus Rokuibacteriota bacterium]
MATPRAMTSNGSTETRRLPSPKVGWAEGTGKCVRDFVGSSALDPTVMVMVPLVAPVCAALGVFHLKATPPPTSERASVLRDSAIDARQTAVTLQAADF